MNKSILVLDENSVIHGQVTSALETEGLTLHHEFNPGRYVERATSLMPDLILVGNSARDPEFDVCRRLKDVEPLADVPMVLMAGSKDTLSRERLDALHVAGVVRKPFEASDLQQQVSKHLDLVDLIGSAYEFRQSQRMGEEGANPLANLDVVDDEVMGLLRGETPAGAAPGNGGAAGTPTVVDDEVLAEALQPERAFEVLDDEAPPPPPPAMEPLETLDGDFPSEADSLPADEAQLEELGAEDVLEEDTTEEMVFEPQGFDEDLDAEGGAEFQEVLEGEETTLDDIEVELPEDAVDMDGLSRDLGESSVDLFESDLSADASEGNGSEELEEAIPLSVRRMMELKPVFTMTQEESAEEEVLEPFDFAPDDGDVQALQAGLDDLDEVSLDSDEAVEEQELEFVSEQELESMEVELGAGTDLAPEPGIAADLEPPDEFDLMGEAPLAEPAPVAEETAPAPEDEGMDVDALEVEEHGDDSEAEELEAAEIDADLVEELASPDAGEPAEAAAPEPAPAPPADEIATAAPEEEDEDELFREEYLGEDEIDEEQIIAAEMDEPPEEQPELTAEDEAELEGLLAEDEHLADLEGLDEEELLAEDDAQEDADIAIEAEEEAQILGRLEDERLSGADIESAGETHEEPSMTAEPLFERNFNALDEEGAPAPAPGPDEAEETWQLSQQEGGFAMAEDTASAAETEGLGAEEQVINLESPLEEAEAGALDEFEEVPASALEEVQEDEGADPSLAEEEAPVSIEFGEGEGEVFDPEESESEDGWRPKAPPGFIAKPAEDFPVDAVRDPFTGPQGEPEVPEPPPAPRHSPEEVLEVLEHEDADVEPDQVADAVQAEADLADQVAPHELDGDDDDAGLDDDFDSEPTLSVLADDTLQSVSDTGDAGSALDEAELEPMSLDDAGLDEAELEPMSLDDAGLDDAGLDEAELEPMSLDDAGLDGDAELTDGEREALFGGGLDEMSGEPQDVAEEDDLESMLGGDVARDAPEAEAAPALEAMEAGGGEFDNLFASLREEIAANPEGERLDDVLRRERIRDRISELDFSLPAHETTFSRALGVYAVPGDGQGDSQYPAALQGTGMAAAAAEPAPSAGAAEVVPPPSASADSVAPEMPAAQRMAQVSALSLLDEDIREKLGQVLDEIISISVRKAVQEEMPKLMERMTKDR